ncbi:MAG: serine hydrolase [Bryobacteraceae bacterium]
MTLRIALAASCALVASQAADLDARVQALIKDFPGQVSLCARNLSSGAGYALRADAPVRTASTIKLPILVALFAEVEAGRAKWQETLTLTPDQKVGGSGVLANFSDGLQLPLRDVARMMIVVSDNTATNLILDRITADRVNETIEELGFERTRSLRKILGPGGPRGHSKAGREKANERYGIGISTPREMVSLLEKIHKGEVVSKAASAEIIEIMKRQHYKDAIGRHTKFAVASKSGALDRLRSDVGIVYAPNGPVAIALTVDGLPETDYSPDNRGNKLLSEIANLVVEELVRP